MKPQTALHSWRKVARLCCQVVLPGCVRVFLQCEVEIFLRPTCLCCMHWRGVMCIFPKKEKQTQKEQCKRRFVSGRILFLWVLTGNRYSKQAKINKQVTGAEMKPRPGNRAAGPVTCLLRYGLSDRFWRIPLTDPALLSLLTSFVVGQAVTDWWMGSLC